MPKKGGMKKGGEGNPLFAYHTDTHQEFVEKHVKIYGDIGSKYIVFNLPEGKTIQADNGTLLYVKGGYSFDAKTPIKGGGFLDFLGSAKTIAKRVSAGESAFLKEYTGPGIVALGSPLPGDVTMLTIYPGQTYYLSKDTFIAATSNVVLEGAFGGFMGSLVGEGAVLPTVATKDSSIGYVWIGGYGTFEKHELASNESIIINNGLFLASTRKYVKTTKLGKNLIKAALGEGLGLEFQGQCTVYTQSKNSEALIQYIQQRLPKN